MSLIQNPTISRKLQRALRLTGLPDSILSPETVPVVLVEDLSAPLGDESRGCYGSGNQGGVAAENSLVALVLRGIPASYDLVVTHIDISTDTSQFIRIIRPTVTLSGFTVLATQFADFSLPGSPTSVLQRDTAVGIPAGIVIKQFRVLADTSHPVPIAIRLFGADTLNAILIAAETVNTSLQANVEWTESSPLG